MDELKRANVNEVYKGVETTWRPVSIPDTRRPCRGHNRAKAGFSLHLVMVCVRWKGGEEKEEDIFRSE